MKPPLDPAIFSPSRVISRFENLFAIDKIEHTDIVNLERLEAASLDSDRRTEDSFEKSPVSIPDTSSWHANSDQNTPQTCDPLPSATFHFGRKIFKPARFTIS